MPSFFLLLEEGGGLRGRETKQLVKLMKQPKVSSYPIG